MQDGKRDIRYIGFESTADGGRRFDFSVSAPDRLQLAISFDIPGILFAGTDRILVQEGAGICSKKLKELISQIFFGELPALVLLTGHDISLYREPSKAQRFQRTNRNAS